jgi:predicted exporter
MRTPLRTRALALSAWAAFLALAGWLAANAHYSSDLSAFLPSAPTPAQALLVEQLREGPSSRMILVAIEGSDGATRAGLSRAMARNLRADARFRSISNGDSGTSQADQQFVFGHRYLLSEQVTAARFAGRGLADALAEGVDMLGSSMGLLARDLFARDPTGETLAVLGQYERATRPNVVEGAWSSRDGQRALLVADVRASGADTDAQQAAMAAIRAAFEAARAAVPATQGAPGGQRAQPPSLRMTGTGVFSVESRALIEREARRLSAISTALIALFLLAVYRSPRVLLLGLLPVLSGALAGVAAVAAGFKVVHALTLGFGVTLIGESVDYSIYLLVQGQRSGGVRDQAGWLRSFWPTVRLGLFTSVIGFLSLLPSSFPGLAQLGLYSIAGLLCAALVTRFVLPELLPARLPMAELAPLGAAFLSVAASLHRWRLALWGVPVLALAAMLLARVPLWYAELSALNPVSREAQQFDARTRADLGAADVRTVVVVTALSAEAALAGAEDASAALAPLVARGELAGTDSAARYLPSERTQRTRQAALPEAGALRAALAMATRSLPVAPSSLAGFVDDVAAARNSAPLVRADLDGTAMAAAVDAMLVPHAGRWSALLPLEARHSGPGAWHIDLAQVEQALAPVSRGGTEVVVLDLKRESDTLYAGYLHEVMRLSLAGFAAILVLLAFTLRSAGRVLRVLAPLVLAVLVVLAVHALAGWPLTLLHLVGLLLIFAIGSNYALFFDRAAAQSDPQERARTVASLLVANLTTVMGFGALALSSVPVLSAVGGTVAPGALLALLFSAVLARPGPHARA